jgi:predicted transcriptional regulator
MGRNGKVKKATALLKIREQITSLYLQGVTQAKIGRVVGISQQAVSNHLVTVREEWLRSSLRDFDAVKAEQLAKLDKVESTAWQAWQRSMTDASRRTSKERMEGETQVRELTEVVEGQSGDPRYLNVVLDCIERRCKIMGLMPTQKIALTDPSGTKPGVVGIIPINPQSLDDGSLEKLAAAYDVIATAANANRPTALPAPHAG